MSRPSFTRTFGVTVITLAGLCACTERLAPTAAHPSGPAFDFSNNPDNGNPRILRFGSTVGFLIVDVDHNLFSIQSGTDRQAGCHAADVFDVMSVQWILSNPDDPTARIMEKRLGQGVYIAVFRGPFPFADCADLMSRKIAEGTGNFVNTDNDLSPDLRDHNNYNAFGFTAQGELDSVDGSGKVHYNGVSKCVWDGFDLASLKCEDKINLQ